MEALKKWLVGLDLTDHDSSILKFTRLLNDILHPESIEFVFVAQQLTDSVHIHLPEPLKYPAHDDLRAKLKTVISEYFADEDRVSCEVLDGPVQFDLWHETYVKDIDLFIAGSKPRHRGRGLFPKKFIRKSVCSVLFVPLDVPENIGKIWVPTDFSDQSGEALRMALHMAQKVQPPAEVVVHHIYQLPHAYYYKDFPRHELLEAVRLDAENQFTKFSKNYNSNNKPISTCFTELYQSYAANNIKQESETASADLILMASGGRSRFSKCFLGSETEQLVQLEVQAPLLVLKKKADHIKLWDLYSISK